jgi:hypothetical protein
MPVPSNSQCSGFAQIQSAPPVISPVERAPISVFSLGLSCGSLNSELNRSLPSRGPNRSTREKTRFGRPFVPGRKSIRPQHVLPDRNATFSPPAIAAFNCSNISIV